MRISLPFAFLALLFAEIAGFIFVGRVIGVSPTLLLVFAGMVLGIALLRRHGVQTLMRVREELAAGRSPGKPLAEGAIAALGALLVAIPGFLTDIAGLLLFVSAVRRSVLRLSRRRFAVASRAAGGRSSGRDGVVDLDPEEYRRTDRADSPWQLRGPSKA